MYPAHFSKWLTLFERQSRKLSPHSMHSDDSFPKSGMSNQTIRNYDIVQHCLFLQWQYGIRTLFAPKEKALAIALK